MQIIRSNGRPHSIKADRNRFFYPNEYGKVFDVMKPKQRHTMKCLLNTGARINELRHVKMEDIDFINRRMILRVTKTKGKLGESLGRVRTIPLSSQFTKYLRGHSNTSSKTDYLGILSTPAFDIAIKKACQKAGIADYRNFSAHNLRKTLECWLMALGVQDMALTAHLGHDIRTAVSHYVSPDIFSFEEKRQMREIIGDLYQR